MNSILCSRCGVFVDLTTASRRSHDCDRFLVAERWEGGRVVETQTSFVPGMTGPVQLVRVRRYLLEDAGEWRLPTPEDPWSLRWVADADLHALPA